MCAKRWLWERAHAAHSKAPNRSSLWSFTVVHKHITQTYMAVMQAKHIKLKLILMKKAITSYKCYFTFYLVTKEIFPEHFYFCAISIPLHSLSLICYCSSSTIYVCLCVHFIYIYTLYIYIYILHIYQSQSRELPQHNIINHRSHPFKKKAFYQYNL